MNFLLSGIYQIGLANPFKAKYLILVFRHGAKILFEFILFKQNKSIT
jgi:hypothetical protein